MALIECPQCGKQISDKASSCPSCGFQIEREPEPQPVIFCEECGQQLELDKEVCPNCGCPVPAQKAENPEILQKVEVASIKIPKMSAKKRTAIIGAIILIVVIAVSSIAAIFIVQKNKKEKYGENISLAATTMLLGASNAEKAGGLIHDVWYNTIYKKSSDSTDKYTTYNGNGWSFNDDFNDSLSNLMTDEDFKSKISSIKTNQELVEDIMKELINPPSEYTEAYSKLQTLYDAYIDLTNLAINPTGNLTSYTSSYNSADAAVSNAYKAMQRYIKE